MKKLFFGMACFIGLMFFTSCTQELIDNILAQKPTVEFVSGDDLISYNTGVYFGEPLNFEVKTAPNTSSMAMLSSFTFSLVDIEGNVVFNDNPDIDDPFDENYFEYTLTPENASTYLAIATVSDVNQKSEVDTVIVNYVKPVIEGIGTFEGTVNINGQYTTSEILGNTYNEEHNFENVPVSLILGTVDEENGVSATLDVEGIPVTIYGVMNDNIVTFDNYHFSKALPISISGIDITAVMLDLVINMTGTLDNDVLTLNGNVTGSGKAMTNLAIILRANYTGTIEGSLNKVSAK